MAKYEYRFENLGFALGEAQEQANALGKEGWELVEVVYDGPMFCFFKRKIED